MRKSTYVGLGRAELELDETNPSLLHSDGTASILQYRLRKDETIHQLGVLDSTSNLLDDPDVP